MLLKREIIIWIWDSTNTDVEYKSDVDNYWGITADSMNINKLLCSDTLSFGDINSSKLEVQIYGLDIDNLDGRKIFVMAKDTNLDPYYIVTEDNDPIVTENNDVIVTEPKNTTVTTKDLFMGIIESSKPNFERTHRDIVAYDWLYFHQDDNILNWWNNYRANRQDNYVSALITSFMTELYSHGLGGYSNYTLLLDFYIMTFELENLTVSQMFKWICEPQGWFIECYPLGHDQYTLGKFAIRFIRLNNTTSTTIPMSEFEHDTIDVTDWKTDTIDGALFDSGTGNKANYPTSSTTFNSCTNPYKITDNKLLAGVSFQNLQTIVETFYNYVKKLKYNPTKMPLVISDFNYTLGQQVDYRVRGGTDAEFERNFYIFEIEYSGSLLVNQTLTASASSRKLSE